MGGFKKTVRLLAASRGPSLASATLRISGAIAALVVTISLAGYGAAQPGPPANPRFVWLEQGWTPDVRAAYHHESQGTGTLPIPYSWFVNLQQPDDFDADAGLFSDSAYLERFGFIPSQNRGTSNPNGLPIGFAQTTGVDPSTGKPMETKIGFTCAACHTARIDAGATTILVDGGPALINLGEFGTQLGLALGVTDGSLTRFHRFAKGVLGKRYTFGRELKLHAEVHAVVLQGLGELLQGHGGTTEGFGRLDALNRIGNKVFAEGMKIPANGFATGAPVAYPHIWDTSWFTWVQYNGSIERPMVRNAGEAMGVGALVNYNDGPTPRFTSTVPVVALHDKIEQVLGGKIPPLPARAFSGLTSPRWPAEILGDIKPALAARGAELYRENCQGCHLPEPGSDAFWDSDRWTPVNAAGERYLDLLMIPIARVGTDPAQARDMANRTVLARAALGLEGGTGTGEFRRYGFPDALSQVVQKVVDRGYDSHVPSPSAQERERLNGNRPNRVRALMSYKARPLNGIWATAPYLHNGSVPNLWALLQSSRPLTGFRLGSHTFDPRHVGYVNAGGFQLDPTKPGNSNGGHLFAGPAGVPPGSRPPGVVGRALSDQERWELIEYLKTL